MSIYCFTIFARESSYIICVNVLMMDLLIEVKLMLVVYVGSQSSRSWSQVQLPSFALVLNFTNEVKPQQSLRLD